MVGKPYKYGGSNAGREGGQRLRYQHDIPSGRRCESCVDPLADPFRAVALTADEVKQPTHVRGASQVTRSDPAVAGGTQKTRVATIALQSLMGAHGENWQLLTSAAFISMALPLIVFFSLQKYFVRGLTAGAVKG